MNTLNPIAKEQLINSGFDPFTIQRIESHDLLKEQVNKFIAKNGEFRQTNPHLNESGAFTPKY
ncbi:hypothetical protein LVJ77_08620 [Conchiformibius kuhniae]|uniref:Uncharacterized protein n=1 Tax=Conchiformibius kuhniae TaxID=211502 RepID=A0A8T9MU75_9NEIS|nr:hypothetical protein LVJ77_08610 [Conchiformibius kuhniae]UOP04387.1 hypothetical protein LVJ77_08620 [Conchiformibius kuhniae]